MKNENLKAARDRIDELDDKLQDLISERARIAQEVALIKKSAGENNFYRPAREAEVLRRLLKRNPGPLSDAVMGRLVREIMSACLALEAPLRVAYLGPEGTHTQAAVFKQFGHAVQTRPWAAIDEVFRDVATGEATYGVVPVENSTEGVVNYTLDLLVSSDLLVCGEVDLAVHHHLLSRAAGLDGIRTLYAHAQALAQCRKWLDSRLPNVARQSVSSNGEAARIAAGDDSAAAIAGAAAADLYGLQRLASDIEDDRANTTRFLVIGTTPVPPSGEDRTSLVLWSPNEPGLLYRLLTPFAEAGINLTRIESRPSRRAKWDYNFFVDIEGHAEDEDVKPVLERVRGLAAYFKILGSYPKAVL